MRPRKPGRGHATPVVPQTLRLAPVRRLPHLLQYAVIASIVLHGVLLSIHFRFPDASAGHKSDAGLEIVLVNARHARAPDEADALAQANLDGGGNSEQKVTPKTPLPPQKTIKEGTALAEAHRRVEELEARQQQLLAAAESDAALVTSDKLSEEVDSQPKVSGYDLLDSAATVARMEAQIDRRLEEYARRPRKKNIGARTKEYRFAQYVEDWRQKIERIGTLNYPDAARGKLYGSLILSVLINADGTVAAVEVTRPSGHKLLDDAAVRIVRLAAPFSAFPPNIRRDTDQLEITRTWNFTKSQEMRTN
jgi:protein TonB